MVNSQIAVLLAASVAGVAAFPAFAGKAGMALMEKRGASNYADLSKRAEPVANVSGLVQVPDAAHPFIAPGPTDQRGPCPGLNTLANHGYLPRNGIVNSAQIIAATGEGFNMGADLSAVLAAIAVPFSGDPVTGLFSLGGYDARTSLLGLGLVQNIFGYAGGLDYHSAGIEGDASATREDNYFGDDHTMQPTLFAQMKAFTNNYGGLYTIEPLKDETEARYQNSIATNPEFYYVPLSAILGQGARGFPAYLFSNGTFGAGGVPNEESVSSFFGASLQADGTYKYVPERFPANWYRRGTPFTLVDVVASILDFQTTRNLTFGANAGKVNSFVPLDIAAATNINGTACIILNAIQATVPSFANPLVSGITGIVSNLLETLDPYFAQFGCPAYDPSQAAAYAALSKHIVSAERK